MELSIENVLNIGADEFYRTDRYKLPLAVILINTKDIKAFDILDSCTRQTDIVQQLNADLLVVFLVHTTYKDALSFINKINDKLSFTYTLDEYKQSHLEFVKDMFKQNIKNNNLSF